MQSHYFISRDGQSMGPWTLAEIAQKMADGQVSATDFIFDDKRKEWIPVISHEGLLSFIKARRPKDPPPVQNPNPISPKTDKTNVDLGMSKGSILSANLAEWYIQKVGQTFGPLTFDAMIKALQDKEIFEFDMIWKEGMDKWCRLGEHPEFMVEKIKEYHVQNGASQSVFALRQHPRFEYKSEVLVHDNKAVWLGQAFQASRGGSGMVIRNANLIPGQNIHIHFTGKDGMPPFHAMCEVVSKKFVKDVRFPRTPVPYGVKFLDIEPVVQEQLQSVLGRRSS